MSKCQSRYHIPDVRTNVQMSVQISRYLDFSHDKWLISNIKCMNDLSDLEQPFRSWWRQSSSHIFVYMWSSTSDQTFSRHFQMSVQMSFLSERYKIEMTYRSPHLIRPLVTSDIWTDIQSIKCVLTPGHLE